MLMGHSRRSHRELAEKLNLSVTAVHNRIQALIDADIIRKFTARPEHKISFPKHNIHGVLV